KLIQPFYLQMMRLNALDDGLALLPAIVKRASTLDADDVVQLLSDDEWRFVVMGAWFALLRDEADVREAVLRGLEASLGSLTSPPLCIAAVVLAGRDALPALVQYAVADQARGYGACGFAAAAAEHLGGSVACEPSETDRNDFAALLAFAERLREMR